MALRRTAGRRQEERVVCLLPMLVLLLATIRCRAMSRLEYRTGAVETWTSQEGGFNGLENQGARGVCEKVFDIGFAQFFRHRQFVSCVLMVCTIHRALHLIQSSLHLTLLHSTTFRHRPSPFESQDVAVLFLRLTLLLQPAPHPPRP